MPRKPKIPPEVLADVGRRLGGRLVPVELSEKPKRVELLESTPTSATVRAVFAAPNEWAAKAVRFIKGWAKNMRDGAADAERNEHGKVSLFSAVGQAEYQGIDLEGSADLLEEVAATI
jgi:hypothetical protein